MKSLNRFLLAAALLCSVVSLPAQVAPPLKSLTITGTMGIVYGSRTNPDKGVDTYTLNVNVANSFLYKGTITQRPFVHNIVGANQSGKMSYALDLSVMNPADITQTKNVGRLYGDVPVDEKNVYRFDDGQLKISVLPIGQAKGFESRFTGLALGKAPATSGGVLARIKKEALTLTSAKGGKVTLTNYDIMRFQNHVLAAGPIQLYADVTASGDMVFDYQKSIWYFKNLKLDYGVNGQRMFDTLTGTIRWIEDPHRAQNGVGFYDFDLRVNEPAPTEAATFAASDDESSFFQQDLTTPSLTGRITYKDTMNGESVSASAIEIDLHSNKLTKQQVVYLSKLIFLSLVVPLNAE